MLALAWVASGLADVLPAEVTLITWPTEHASPGPKLSAAAQAGLPALRLAFEALPESLVVRMALSQPAFLGLPPEAADKLQDLVAKRYELIKTDAAFKEAPSLLPYCFSARRPANGQALLYKPRDATERTPAILFLHGYGGSFIWYQQWLAEVFPDHYILCPAWGISPAGIPAAYLKECIAAVEHEIGHKLAQPTLLGLSAGAFGAAQVYASDASPYTALVLLAGYPPPDIQAGLARRSGIHLIAGGAEGFVTDGTWDNALKQLRTHDVKIDAHLIPQADHFFLLTHPAEFAEWLKGACRSGR